ncbi:uncharacterized protein LOC113763929 [Coffea eugenioides]|uniref:Uncharacterized protein n=1 Tax=Coffea arabica TaxID=13443 RepID=A0A6P6W2R9_COFAR|nr:uncharacterized protein LOC113729679 [Coffea arabica]XP_027163710.1 uncharacterized protein LOC113763912 [Coffea eugenioides]XP_027163725.1 uncharacterized protein LOC113763929 [Coffea eugenioides]
MAEESGMTAGGGDRDRDRDVEELQEEEKDEDNIIGMINSRISLDTSTSGVNPSSPLWELNLLILLSFLSLSPEECLDLENFDENTHKDSRPRHPLSPSLQIIRKRQMCEFRAPPERQSARFQTRARDCRHFRQV